MDLDLWHRLVIFEKADCNKMNITVSNYMLGGLTSTVDNAENVVYEHWLVKQSYFSNTIKGKMLMQIIVKLTTIKFKFILRHFFGEKTFQVFKSILIKLK